MNTMVMGMIKNIPKVPTITNVKGQYKIKIQH